MKTLLSLLILFTITITIGQTSIKNRIELETYSATMNTMLTVSDSESLNLLVKGVLVENPDLNPCLEIETTTSKNLQLIELLDELTLLDNVYALIEFEFVEINSGESIKTDNVKFFIQLDYEPPGHFESLFIPIFDKDQIKVLTNELSIIFGYESCFRKVKRAAKKKVGQ